MERPNIPPNCTERYFLATANYVFTAVFTVEMMIKVMYLCPQLSDIRNIQAIAVAALLHSIKSFHFFFVKFKIIL